MENYDWQDSLYFKWRDNGYQGVLRGVTAAGKTQAGLTILSLYQADHPHAKALVLSPFQDLNNQWIQSLEQSGLNADVKGYQKALSDYRRGKSERYDICIADECQALCTDVQGQLIKEKHLPNHIIGMSATPKESVDFLGGVIEDINYDRANVSPFSVHYIRFPMSPSEEASYQKWSDKMRAQSDKTGAFRPGMDKLYDFFTMKRRDCVYRFSSRLPIAMEIIKENAHRRMMIFCERTEQVEQMSKQMSDAGIPNCKQVGYRKELHMFTAKEVNAILSVKMLQVGFNDPDTEVGIIVSTATTAQNHIQTIGRVIRAKEGKHADIYVLLAKGTTDENLIKEVKFPKEYKVTVEEWNNH